MAKPFLFLADTYLLTHPNAGSTEVVAWHCAVPFVKPHKACDARPLFLPKVFPSYVSPLKSPRQY